MKQLSIIGLSGSGKTCYTYAMAKTMIKGYNGINAIAIDDSVREQLNVGWRMIRKEMKWPDGNDKTLRREFNCQLNLKSIMDFCWDDFKGGELTSMNEVAEKFRIEFNSYLKKSDGLILFVPADVYLDIIEETESGDDLYEDLEILNTLFVSNSEHLSKIPITIVITKADLLDDNSKEYVFDFIKDLLSPLFTIGNNMKVLMVPVSIGEGLGRGIQGGFVKGVVYADPKKGNIHIPIVYNLYHFLKDCLAVEKSNLGVIGKEIDSRLRCLREAERRNGLQRWWYGDNISELERKVKDREDERKRKLAEINGIEANIEKVKNLFTEDCQYFINGKKAEF